MKKILSGLLVLSIVGVQFLALPVNAKIKLFPKTNKNKVTTSQKYQYINIDWWNNFNDSYLTEYINKAIFKYDHRCQY